MAWAANTTDVCQASATNPRALIQKVASDPCYDLCMPSIWKSEFKGKEWCGKLSLALNNRYGKIVFRAYSWSYAQGSLLDLFRGLYVVAAAEDSWTIIKMGIMKWPDLEYLGAKLMDSRMSSTLGEGHKKKRKLSLSKELNLNKWVSIIILLSWKCSGGYIFWENN